MRRARCTHGPLARRAGFSLIEMTIAFTVMTIILVATSAVLRRETRGINELQNMGHAEKVMETAFARILRTVQFARGFSPETTLTSTLTGGETGTARLSDITGFPDSGVFVVDLGDPTEEIVAYSGTSAADDQLLDLERGAEGSQKRGHSAGSTVLWSGLAKPIDNQTDPAASEYDGRTDDLRGDIYYRGRGAGLSFQVPVDPENTGSFVGAEGPRWGAQVAGGEVTGAHAAICFVRSLEITESERDFDLNEDGDLEDTFDLGRIVYQGWSDDPAESIRINLTPSIILQEKGAYGTDMDDDGYEDPMFLWTPPQARLRMRFFVLAGTVNQREVVRRFETIIHLRNGAAE